MSTAVSHGYIKYLGDRFVYFCFFNEEIISELFYLDLWYYTFFISESIRRVNELMIFLAKRGTDHLMILH